MAKPKAASRPNSGQRSGDASSKQDPPPLIPESDSDESDSESESDYSDEDEDGEELTPALDAAILRTLSKIRRKDGVYGTDNVLQEELKHAEQAANKMGIKRAHKTVEEKDLHRKNLLAGETSESIEPEGELLTNVEAERRARAEALSAFKAFAESDEEDDEENTGGLIRRDRNAEEMEEEEAEYRKFLLEMGGGEDAVRSALGMGDQPVSRYREDLEEELGESSLTEVHKEKNEIKAPLSEVEKQEMLAERRAKRAKDDEDFLMNYILNRGWIDKSGKHVPTYEEIVGRPRSEDEDEDENKEDEAVHPWGKIDEEDDFDEAAEEFETTYNFRFEEPGSSTIATHPRQIDTLVRRDDDKRKLKRQERAERKAAERAAQEEKIRAKKGEKRREVEKSIASLKKELGEDGMDWKELEKIVDGDYDEAEWERVVGKMLEAKALAEDEQKPTWDDDFGNEYDEEDQGGEYSGGEEFADEGVWDGTYAEEDDDAPINMDADFVDEPSESKRSKRKKSKKGKGEKIEDDTNEAGGNMNPEASVVDKAARIKKAVEDYRALDHEDMIGDLPTRFKYTRSTPASFGLSPVEILLATDAELNSLVSVKHIAPYRRRGLGLAGQGLGKRVRDLKRVLQGRKWGEEVVERPGQMGYGVGGGWGQKGKGEGASADGSAGREKKKRLGPKERRRLAAVAGSSGGGAGEGVQQVESVNEGERPSGAKRKRNGNEEGEVDGEGVGVNGGESGGKRRRRKRGKKGAQLE